MSAALGRPDWRALEPEIMRHYQAVLRLDTTNPPGNEHLAVDYLKQVFDAEGIPSQIFALDPNRSNIVARLKGNGKKRPLLIMGHTDDVTVDASKWKFPPFSATRDGGYVYARGTIDDKDNLTAGLMTMVMLKRLGRCRSIATSSSSRSRARKATRTSASSSWSRSTSTRSTPSTASRRAAASRASAASRGSRPSRRPRRFRAASS